MRAAVFGHQPAKRAAGDAASSPLHNAFHQKGKTYFAACMASHLLGVTVQAISIVVPCIQELDFQSSSASLHRVMFCGLLFLCANVLKKLLAKLFSSHFYKATHYDKMQDALRKEFFMVALSQPREDREEDDPMKHKPSTLAELRTKSFAAGGALVREEE